MAGQELTDIRSSELKTRLNDGMSRLVEIVYPNLKMLTIEYDDSMLRSIIDNTSTGIFGIVKWITVWLRYSTGLIATSR